MDATNDSFPTRLTFGVEGSRTTTRDIEGEVWQQPYHNLLALPSWLKLWVKNYLFREIHDVMREDCDSLS